MGEGTAMTGSPSVPPLVSPEWALEHLDDPAVRFVDVEYDGAAYAEGHLPTAVRWTWARDLVDPVRRELASADATSALLARSGIGRETHVVLYGDDDWYAAWALWQLRLHGLGRISLLDGGRAWWRTRGLPYVAAPFDAPSADPALPPPAPGGRRPGAALPEPEGSLRTGHGVPVQAGSPRIHHGELRSRLGDGLVILDVRLAEEYRGELTAPAGYGDIAQRAGHIPGAIWAPWDESLGPDGRFRPPQELRARYAGLGLDDQQEVVTYCGVGVRSSHTWFVLHELLGYERARNYDGGWAEWGSVIGAPIETGPGPSQGRSASS